MLRSLLAALPLLLIPAVPAAAQEQVLATSPDAQFRLIYTAAVDPSTGPATLSLIDTKAAAPARELWRQPWPKDLRRPTGYWLDDSGWLIIESNKLTLIALEPKTGAAAIRAEILDQIPADERTRFVESATDIGIRWDSDALRVFFTDHDTRFFAVRTWWGRQIILDLQGHRVAQQTPPLAGAAVEAEESAVLSDLERAGRLLARPPAQNADPTKVPAGFFDARRAVHLAGLMHLRAAARNLRMMESWTRSDSRVGVSTRCPESAEGPDVSLWEVNTLRYAAQLSLRRLGEQPERLPAFELLAVTPAGTQRISTTMSAGAQQFLKLSEGLDALQVLDLVGSPDDIVTDRSGTITWEYDVVGNNPETVQVQWSCNRVQRISRVRPRWIEPGVRDAQLVH